MKKTLGIDLGTANTLVYVQGEGIVVNEPSVVAIDQETEEVVAVGAEAKAMLGRTPGHIQAERPIKDGVIADYTSTRAMLQYFIKKVVHTGFFAKPNLLLCAPYGITDVENRALIDVALQSGANDRGIYLMDEPMAAAIGAGLPVLEPVGSMVVDIGGGTSEIAVISLGGIVQSSSLKIAGDALDEAISNYIRRISDMTIGEQTSENIKVTIGTVFVDDNTMQDKLVVKGRDALSGLPKSIALTNFHVAEALYPTVMSIVECIVSVLEKTPPELAGDIYDNGIVLTGGGALMRDMDVLISKMTGLRVRVADDPAGCVIKGISTVIEDMDQYRKVLTDASVYY